MVTQILDINIRFDQTLYEKKKIRSGLDKSLRIRNCGTNLY